MGAKIAALFIKSITFDDMVAFDEVVAKPPYEAFLGGKEKGTRNKTERALSPLSSASPPSSIQTFLP